MPILINPFNYFFSIIPITNLTFSVHINTKLIDYTSLIKKSIAYDNHRLEPQNNKNPLRN